MGFGSGNGLGIARAFGSAGFKLGLISRNPELQADSLAGLAALGIQAIAFPADAGNPKSLANAILDAPAQLGEPDVLIYNVVAPHFGRASTICILLRCHSGTGGEPAGGDEDGVVSEVVMYISSNN